MPDMWDPEGALEMDDGASEVVQRTASRPTRPPVDPAEAAFAPAGGRLADLDPGEPSYTPETITIRSPHFAARITYAQVEVFRAVWRGWLARRAAGEDDPGVPASKIAADLKKPLARVNTTLKALVHHDALRTARMHYGSFARRAHYYPTEAGIQAFAIAETFGDGSLVQVGRSARAWRNRAATQPADMFQHAAFLRGVGGVRA